MGDLMCEHCGWVGDDTELVSLTEDMDDKDFLYCPDCECADFEQLDDGDADA
jgi:rubredoxin